MSSLLPYNKPIWRNNVQAWSKQSKFPATIPRSGMALNHCMTFDVFFHWFTCVAWITFFKERYRNHKTSFRHVNKRNSTELPKHVWKLKDAKTPFSIKWKVIKKCKPYNNITKKCNLCLYEKFVIICRKDLCSLNKRNELASSCPHRNRYVLQNFKIT